MWRHHEIGLRTELGQSLESEYSNPTVEFARHITSVKQRTLLSEIASHCLLLSCDTVLKFRRWKRMFRRKSPPTKTHCVVTHKNTSWEDFKCYHLGLLPLSCRLHYRLVAQNNSRKRKTVKIYLYVYSPY